MNGRSTGQPRVLVIGCGSMGTRHSRNLSAAGAEVFVTDPDQARASALSWARPVSFDLKNISGFDGIVIASPTHLHVDQARAALDTGARVLVEKPLAMDGEQLKPILGDADRIMVGYSMRFYEPLRRIVGLAHSDRAGTIYSVRLWYGNYLPNWRRPGDYRSWYSARAEQGGGILLDAIHELDLAQWIMGPDLEVVGSVVDRVSDLEIDTEDTVRALLRHPEGASVEISLDYLSRRYRRGIEIVAEHATIRLDSSSSTLQIEDESGVQSEDVPAEGEETYELEAKAFLAWLKDDAMPPVDGRAGAASVRLADDIRRKSRTTLR